MQNDPRILILVVFPAKAAKKQIKKKRSTEREREEKCLLSLIQHPFHCILYSSPQNIDFSETGTVTKPPITFTSLRQHSTTITTMDPCPFVRLTVESLALKLPSPTKPASVLSGVHPTTTPCFCKIRIKSFPSQTALLPLSNSSTTPDSTTSAPAIHLDSEALRRFSRKPMILSISVYIGPMGRNCGVCSAKLLGHVLLPIQLPTALSPPNTFHNGWLKLNGNNHQPSPLIHLLVRSEPDPRFVFHFGSEPECSPVVFQIQGNIRQPVFSCKFSADRNHRSP